MNAWNGRDFRYFARAKNWVRAQKKKEGEGAGKEEKFPPSPFPQKISSSVFLCSPTMETFVTQATLCFKLMFPHKEFFLIKAKDLKRNVI